MSITKAHIEEKWLRKVKIAHIPIVDEDGNRKSKRYTELNGALLVPVTDAHLFNTSKSTIKRYMKEGDLLPYHANGQVKTDNRCTRVFFNLYEYLNLDKNKGINQ